MTPISFLQGMNSIKYLIAHSLTFLPTIHSFGVIKVIDIFMNINRSLMIFVRLILGALCVYDGIVDALWVNTSDLSMLKKVAEISGSYF